MHSGGGSHLLKHGVRLKESLRESDRQTDLSYMYIYIYMFRCVAQSVQCDEITVSLVFDLRVLHRADALFMRGLDAWISHAYH
jgi:hypothetical protein